jgi:hypothetical protein
MSIKKKRLELIAKLKEDGFSPCTPDMDDHMVILPVTLDDEATPERVTKALEHLGYKIATAMIVIVKP